MVVGAEQLYVTTDTGRVHPAMVVATDPRSDLAILKIPVRLPAVEFAPAPTGVPARRGQWVVAVGNPVGLGGEGGMCVSAGLVSATGRNLPKLSRRENRLYSNLLQITAEVNPGNSGGPLFDLAGRVVGVVTAVVLPYGTTNGVGFAMPADETLLAKIDRLRRGDTIEHGFLGVAVQEVVGGARVTRVGEASPAEGIIQVGDVLIRIGGERVVGEEAFIRLVGSARTDRGIPLVVRRDGREVALSVQLAPREDDDGIGHMRQRLRWRGVTFANCRKTDGTLGVVVIHVDENSPLNGTASAGRLLRAVRGQAVASLLDAIESLDRSGPADLTFQAAADEE